MVSEISRADALCVDVVQPSSPSEERKARQLKFAVIASYCVCCLVWGTTWYVVRLTVVAEAGPSPYFTAAIRFAIGVCLFLPLLAVFGRKLRLPTRGEFGWLAAAGIFNGLYQICVYYAERHISGGLTAVVAATAPLMVALMAVSTKTEKVSIKTIIGFCAAFVGVGMVCHDRMNVSIAQAGATMIMVLAAFWNATTSVTLKRASSDSLSPIVSAPLYLTVTVLPVWACSLIMHEPQTFAVISPSSWYAIIYLAVMSSFLSFGLYLFMLKHVSLMTISTLPFVLPVLALIVDLFLEKSVNLSFESWLGIGVVLLGVVYSMIKRN